MESLFARVARFMLIKIGHCFGSAVAFRNEMYSWAFFSDYDRS